MVSPQGRTGSPKTINLDDLATTDPDYPSPEYPKSGLAALEHELDTMLVEHAILYEARPQALGAVNNRLTNLDHGGVTFKRKDYRTKGHERHETMNRTPWIQHTASSRPRPPQ